MQTSLDPYDTSLGVGTDFAFFATATGLDLRTVSGKPQRCPRRIVALTAQAWGVLETLAGVDEAPGDVPEGFTHDAATSVITSDGPIMVYW